MLTKNKAILSAKEAWDLLGVERSTFYQLAKDPATLLRRSKRVNGKYIFSSVKDEFKRLHGYSYEDSI